MLTDRDRAILDVEARFYARPGSKETAVALELGMTSTRYHQRLHQLVDDHAALAHAPVLVRRLQRLRAARLARTGV